MVVKGAAESVTRCVANAISEIGESASTGKISEANAKSVALDVVMVLPKGGWKCCGGEGIVIYIAPVCDCDRHRGVGHAWRCWTESRDVIQ